MGVAEDLMEGLEQFRDQLKRGERIMATTVEQCGCWRLDENNKPTGDPKCHVCAGRGYTFDATTILPAQD